MDIPEITREEIQVCYHDFRKIKTGDHPVYRMQSGQSVCDSQSGKQAYLFQEEGIQC